MDTLHRVAGLHKTDVVLEHTCSFQEAMTHSITLEESERRVDALLDSFYCK